MINKKEMKRLLYKKEATLPSFIEIFLFIATISGAVHYKAWFVLILLLLVNLPELILVFRTIKKYGQ